VRKGGKHKFYADAWLPSDAIRGELAERWEWKENPLSVVVYLRKWVMFPDKPGVMKALELTAEDIVFSYDRLDKSPRKIPAYFDHIAKVEARDKYTVVFTFKEYNAEPSRTRPRSTPRCAPASSTYWNRSAGRRSTT